MKQFIPIALSFISLILGQAATAKTRIAVTAFEDKAGDSRCAIRWFSSNLGSGMADQLITALSETGKFDIQERETLNKMYQQEHNLINAEASSLPEANGFRSAHYSIVGSITSFEMCDKGVGGKLDVGSLIGFKSEKLKVGAKKADAKVVIDLRVVDVAKGNVLKSVRAEGHASSMNFDVDGTVKGASFDTDAFKNSPIGEATRAALDDAVKKIVKVVPDRKDKPLAIDNKGGARKTASAKRQASSASHSAPTSQRTEVKSSLFCSNPAKDSVYTMCKTLSQSQKGDWQVLFLDDAKKTIIPAASVKNLKQVSAVSIGDDVYISCKNLANMRYLCGYKASMMEKSIYPCTVVDVAGGQVSVNCGGGDLNLTQNAVYQLESYKARTTASKK